MKVTLQIPMDKNLKINGEKYAKKIGYSSLQEYIRVKLKKTLLLSSSKNKPLFPDEYLTPEQEAILDKRSAEIDKNIKKGEYIKSSNIDELIAYLNSG